MQAKPDATFEAPSFVALGHSDSLHLRVLATTDLHAHLLPFDYFTDTRANGTGLACLGEMIAAARQTSPNVLLLDNGDTLQGAPLADAAKDVIVPGGRPHPMISAMSALGYDAATLGNHDFDFGVPHLEASLAAASFPIVAANTSRANGEAFLPRRILLNRVLTDRAGQNRNLKIGITGVLPSQIAQWNWPHLHDKLVFTDIVEAARKQAMALRAEGADLVVVLAHSGYGALDAKPMAENVACQVAQLPGVDAVIAGHTHMLRPYTAEYNEPATGAALVQPGAFGSHLGCIDLLLEPDSARGWRVVQSRSMTYPTKKRKQTGAVHLRRILSDYPALRTEIARDHVTTRTYVAKPLGATSVPLETYFSALAPCAATQVVADAQLAAVRALVADCAELAELPVISAVAPFKSGGRAGAKSYTDIPAGPLKLRHAADLYLYPNMLSVLRVTGEGIRAWLERAASIFHQIEPDGTTPQPLINPDFAPYNFDRLVGLTYDIDVSQPARTNVEGDVTFTTPGRIKNLRFASGAPVEDSDEMVVITNSYRSAGGGNVKAAAQAEEIMMAPFSVRDAVATYIASVKPALHPVVAPNFRLLPLGGVCVEFQAGVESLNHPGRLADLSLTPDGGPDEAGFQRFLMSL